MRMANFNRKQDARAGFTIIELLVIVSVIGLLFALLLPALQAAREATRKSTCQSNLRQQGLGMLNFEQAWKHLPSGGEGTDFTQNPPATVFEVASTFALIMPHLNDESYITQPVNLAYAYNDAACPANQTSAKMSIPSLLCPSNATRLIDPNGYGQTDYMPTVYTDIDPQTGVRNLNARKAGALRLGGTMTAKITDGLSRTIAIAEDAGRSHETSFPNTQSAYPDPVFSGGTAPVWNATRQVTYTQWLAAHNLTSGGLPAGDAPTPSGHRVLNRWAEPASAGGISGQSNFAPASKVYAINGNRTPWGGPPNCPWSQTNCGPNEEMWSWHTGGANVLMCDGSVRTIGQEINPVVLRMLVTADEQDIFDDTQVPY
ncbi:MAG TPA: DUF1559 domain-containing protein [Pirellulales bacterium]|nr:DUF1559 domain-containing protein [Pirellulales bacterium]